MYGQIQMDDELLLAEKLAMMAEEQAGGVYRIDVSQPWRQLEGCLMRK